MNRPGPQSRADGSAHVALREALSTPEGKAPYVRRLFARIADRYDLITVLLSCGQDRRWKRRLVDLAGPVAGVQALDLACGTGDIAHLLARKGAAVTGLDITQRMLELARAKAVPPAARPPRYVTGDMCALPFADASCDLVTTGYGLRNVPDLRGAIAEMARVLRPGGRLLSLDFNRPASAPVRAVYHAYLAVVGGVLGWALHRDPDTYRYIPESIRNYPGAPAVVHLMREQGFADATWHPVLGGLMAIHAATRAADLARG
jgi:demethylmenaquinone methyltransferase/2-methoxy-6-polyprenyl-1,4-benzoquinol methylase